MAFFSVFMEGGGGSGKFELGVFYESLMEVLDFFEDESFGF